MRVEYFSLMVKEIASSIDTSSLALYVWQRLNADLELASEEAPSERMQALVQQYSCFDTSGSATDDPLEDSRDSFVGHNCLACFML